MKNDIWDEISSFLNGLRCEKINRKSYIQFQEFKDIQLKKKMKKENVIKIINHMNAEDKRKFKQYEEILEEEAFTSELRAYCQGYVDCIQLLAGLGILKQSPDTLIRIESQKKIIFSRIERVERFQNLPLMNK